MICARRLTRASSFAHYARVPSIVHTGVHDVDIVLWIVGRLPAAVFAKCRSLLGECFPESFLALLDFPDGPMGLIQNGWLLPDAFPSAIEAELVVLGDKGSGHLRTPHLGTLISDSAQTHSPDLFWWPSIYGEVTGALRSELLYFLRCLAEGREPDRVRPEEAREALRVALAIVESAEKGEEVRL